MILNGMLSPALARRGGHLPERYRPGEAFYSRFARWQCDGLWARMPATLRERFVPPATSTGRRSVATHRARHQRALAPRRLQRPGAQARRGPGGKLAAAVAGEASPPTRPWAEPGRVRDQAAHLAAEGGGLPDSTCPVRGAGTSRRSSPRPRTSASARTAVAARAL